LAAVLHRVACTVAGLDIAESCFRDDMDGIGTNWTLRAMIATDAPFPGSAWFLVQDIRDNQRRAVQPARSSSRRPRAFPV
jgi:hypothetical protein